MDNYQIARRAQIGVLIPSTNTGVEYDLQKFALDGVTWHPSRFWIELKNWAEEDEKTGEGINSVFERFLEMMRGELPPAIDSVMSAKISHLMLGMSAETFWGGMAGNIEFEKAITDQIGELGFFDGEATHGGARFTLRNGGPEALVGHVGPERGLGRRPRRSRCSV